MAFLSLILLLTLCLGEAHSQVRIQHSVFDIAVQINAGALRYVEY